MNAARIIEAALAARSEADATRLDSLVAEELGTQFYRPIGDKINNFGLMTTSGSYDYKLIENVTNMQDALLEREAMVRFGDLSVIPFDTPRAAAAALLGGRGEAELAQRASVEFYEGAGSAKSTRLITPVFRDEGCGIEPSYVGDSIFALGSAHKSKSASGSRELSESAARRPSVMRRLSYLSANAPPRCNRPRTGSLSRFVCGSTQSRGRVSSISSQAIGMKDAIHRPSPGPLRRLSSQTSRPARTLR